MVWCRPLLCFVLNLYPNVLDLSHGTVRYAPDNIRSTSRTTNPRQHDNTYASSTRQYIHVYLARSLLEGNGDSTASECDDEDDNNIEDEDDDKAIKIPYRGRKGHSKNKSSCNNEREVHVGCKFQLSKFDMISIE